MPYIIGIDIGGTFTDCVVMDAGGRIVTAKAPSTPDDFSEGVMESLWLAAERLGLTTEALLRDTARLALGTTVGTNAMLQRRGARVGLITTKGHRDVIHIMRGARGVPGLNNVQVLRFPESGKPDPIVPKPLIAEVSERVGHLLPLVVQARGARAAREGDGYDDPRERDPEAVRRDVRGVPGAGSGAPRPRAGGGLVGVDPDRSCPRGSHRVRRAGGRVPPEARGTPARRQHRLDQERPRASVVDLRIL